jgi:hypothetical protein
MVTADPPQTSVAVAVPIPCENDVAARFAHLSFSYFVRPLVFEDPLLVGVAGDGE